MNEEVLLFPIWEDEDDVCTNVIQSAGAGINNTNVTPRSIETGFKLRIKTRSFSISCRISTQYVFIFGQNQTQCIKVPSNIISLKHRGEFLRIHFYVLGWEKSAKMQDFEL